MPRPSRRPRSAFERAYTVVVAVKGLDGVVELVAGLVLLLAPGTAARALAALADELAEGSSVLRQSLAHSVASAGGAIPTAAAPFAVFLLVHGVVKLLTVVALLRRAVRWYPPAMVALGVLLAAQLLDVIGTPSVGGWVLVALDVLVLGLVGWEYRRLRAHRADPAREDARIGAA